MWSKRRTKVYITTLTLALCSAAFLALNDKWLHLNPHDESDQQQVAIRQLQEQKVGSPAPTLGPCVVVLASNNDEDIAELCLALKSLYFLRGGPKREWTKSPVLVFNEGDFLDRQKARIQTCTSRPVYFPVVNLRSFPEGFNPESEWKHFSQTYSFRPVRDRDRWSYSQMIRFWTTTLWKHPAIKDYNVIMRIDTDSCFLWQRDGNLNHLYKEAPNLSGRYVYQSNYENYVGGDVHFIEGLFHFAVMYMQQENMKPANPSLWKVIERTWEEQRNLPVFQTNFEICRKSFFQRKDVMKWHEALAEKHPFGIFRKRWGDAQFRVITVAMFAKEDNILLSKSTGYLHGRGRCAKNFISEIHEQLRTKHTY